MGLAWDRMKVRQVDLLSTTRSHSKSLLPWIVCIFQIAEAAHMIRNTVKNTVCNFGLSRTFSRYLESKYDYIAMWVFFILHKSAYLPLETAEFPTPQHSYSLERPAYLQFISGLVYINDITFLKKAWIFATKRLVGSSKE